VGFREFQEIPGSLHIRSSLSRIRSSSCNTVRVQKDRYAVVSDLEDGQSQEEVSTGFLEWRIMTKKKSLRILFVRSNHYDTEFVHPVKESV
jgi:hypothetical protein